MSDATKGRPVHQVLPENAQPCVWMAAGQVAYKLCDRNFRCEECSFDASFRGQGRVADAQDAGSEDLSSVEVDFPDDRFYDAGHTWAGIVAEGRVRFGLDGFAARLLRHLSGIVLPAAGGRVERGHVGCWVTDDVATLSLKVPVSGTVIRSNPRLRSAPALAAASPYDEGWLLEVDCGDPDAAVKGLLKASEIRERARAGLNQLRDLSMSALEAPQGSPVGRTLADGGEPARDLRLMLGTASYYGIVARLLG